ncbi:MAG: D-lyxose/D-mannose family sugar isomerase [Clostridiales Family XIII bacterium]|jgi:D-lyxose ketol-isomerase|nr:D-lyxose/D-mannose family sugar isomerase [Clostridiales Family XIII bacterium]
MKRSEINACIKDAEAFMAERRFALPPFASWTPEDWTRKGQECDEIRDNMLGWDITDYGLGRFDEIGLVLITLRNGNQNNAGYEKPYAEKILISRENQICPMHYHIFKMEDIINRGGGVLVMKLYNAGEDGRLSGTDVVAVCDGVRRDFQAGSEIELPPGESITLTTGLYHAFWAKQGHGPVLVGEVSKCNDDNTDNVFLESMGRFPAIDEDEAPYRLLVNEYPQAR